jgi:membrane-bound acyltransferase YfiQ involved in biofilm formation
MECGIFQHSVHALKVATNFLPTLKHRKPLLSLSAFSFISYLLSAHTFTLPYVLEYNFTLKVQKGE